MTLPMPLRLEAKIMHRRYRVRRTFSLRRYTLQMRYRLIVGCLKNQFLGWRMHRDPTEDLQNGYEVGPD